MEGSDQLEIAGIPPPTITENEIARRLLAAWIAYWTERFGFRPSDNDIKKQAVAARRIAADRPLDVIAAAWRGIEQLYRFKNEPWDLFDLEKYGLKAAGQGMAPVDRDRAEEAVAEAAWLDMVSIIQCDSWAPAYMDMPELARAALRSLGGLSAIRDGRAGQLPHVRLAFLKAYRALGDAQRAGAKLPGPDKTPRLPQEPAPMRAIKPPPEEQA